MSDEPLHLILLSDATGSTLASAVKAVLSQFPQRGSTVSMHPFLRSSSDLDKIPEEDFGNASAIIFTLVSDDLKERVSQKAHELGIPALNLLEPVTGLISGLLGDVPSAIPGIQYRVDDTYMAQISAMDFAMSSDDGLGIDRLLSADVILTGVSRTSKTPTCIYLGYQGIRAANVPLVPNHSVYADLEEAISAGVPCIGLTASATRLSQVRKTRLRSLGSSDMADYTDIDQIEEELVNARLCFDRLGIPVIDVTRRSIEETSASILQYLRTVRKNVS